MYDVIVNNPVFSVLSNEQSFQNITEKLQNNFSNIDKKGLL